MKNEAEENAFKGDNINDILIKANSNSSGSSGIDETSGSIIFVKIVLGQILAILCVANAQFSKQIENNPANVFPCLLNAGYYFLFGLFWLIYLRKLTFPKTFFFAIILFDTQANYLKVYSYTTCKFNYLFITYSTSVFFTCVLSLVFVRKYKLSLWHVGGMIIALVGIGLTLYGSVMNYPSLVKEINENYIGISCALGSAVCYSISLVIMDKYFSSGREIYESFPWMGICGTVISICQSFVLNESDKVSQKELINWSKFLWYGGFVISMMIFNTISPFFIRKNSASMLNISLVSQIFWSYLVEVIWYYETNKSYFYYVGFGVIVIGLVIFNQGKVKRITQTTKKHKRKLKLKGQEITEDYLKDNLISTNPKTDSTDDNFNEEDEEINNND